MFDSNEVILHDLIDKATDQIDNLIAKGYLHTDLREESIKRLYYNLKANQDNERI